MTSPMPWNSVNTKLAVWCVGATEGSRNTRNRAPMTCQQAEKQDTHASTLVGSVLIEAWMNSVTALQHQKQCQFSLSVS